MFAHYPETFDREMTCTEADWLRWLPGAVGDCSWEQRGQTAGVRIGDGALNIHWQVEPPRTIAAVRLPRLSVHFRFAGVQQEVRQAFMQRFDLYMQRGGG
mgnify:FL=1